MPNHVTTVCTVHGPAEDVAEFKSRMFVEKTDERDESYLCFDFNRIIPMPASVAAVSGRFGLNEVLGLLLRSPGCADTWKQYQSGPMGHHFGPWKGFLFFEEGEIERSLEAAWPGIVAEARQMALAFGETGYSSWYDWSIAHWGTKWGAYSLRMESDDPLCFRFDTAWDFPTPVFEALRDRYRTLKFECMSFDEGWNFAATGIFSSVESEQTFAKVKATDKMYEAVYGRKPIHEEDESSDDDDSDDDV